MMRYIDSRDGLVMGRIDSRDRLVMGYIDSRGRLVMGYVDSRGRSFTCISNSPLSVVISLLLRTELPSLRKTEAVSSAGKEMAGSCRR
jgi:hypothetical protein